MAHPIPLLYRIPLLYLEPPLALTGAYLLHFDPSAYLLSMTPAAPATLRDVRILTDQLAAFQVVFAFNCAVVLRATRDAAVWRVVCAGMLLSDVLHTAASVREVGGEPSRWRREEWINFGVLWMMGLVRLGVVLGIGIQGGETRKTKQPPCSS